MILDIEDVSVEHLLDLLTAHQACVRQLAEAARFSVLATGDLALAEAVSSAVTLLNCKINGETKQ